MMPLLARISADPNLLTAVVFVGGLLLVVAASSVWSVLFQTEERRLRRRVDMLRTPRAERAEEGAEAVQSLRRNRHDSSIATLDRLIKQLMPNVGLLRLRLERAGTSLRIGDYLLICLTLAATTVLAMELALGLSHLLNALLGIVAGVGLPHVYLQQRIKRRTRKFTALLPEALDLIVRGIRSGLPASEAINTIAEELEDPVGTEFRQISDQMKIGVAMDEALWATAKRLGIPEFNFLVISLAIQQETGGNLAEILEKLSDMVRRREQMRLKVRAMSSEARASAMIIGALPFIMAGVISFVNPTYMSTLFTDPRGWMMIGAGLTSLLFGVAVMSKMVKFEI